LLEAFGEQDSFTRHALVTALERIGRARPEAWSRIAAGLGSPSDRIREGTLLVMRKTLEPEVVRALADFIAGRERPTEARAAALETLAGLHRKLPEWKGEWWGYHPVDRPPPMKTVDWSGTPAVLAALRDATGDPDPRLRSAALRGLREAGERAQLARLRDAFRDERDPEAQAEILTTLGALGDASAAGVLRSVLDDPGRERRVLLAAIDAARTLAAKDLVPSLAKLLHAKEPDPDVAVEAAGALGELGSAAAAPDLLRVLSSANERLRLTAIAALTQIGDGSRAPALMDLLGDPSAEVRRAAIRALGAWKAVGALPALLQAFEREETRFEAAGALALMPDARALDPYLFGITSASATLREDSRKALGAIAPATLPSIEARLLAGTLPPAALGPLRRIYAGVPQAASSELLNRPAKELSIPEYRDFALKTSGDPRRGRKLFEDQKGVACIKCHAAGGGPGGDLGPNLASIGAQYGRDHLAESILEPSKVVRDGYRQEIVALRTGDLLPGVVKSETPEGLVLQTADGEKRRLPRASIRERTASALSLMPEGLQAGLTLEEFADLVEYLASLRGPRRDGE